MHLVFVSQPLLFFDEYKNCSRPPQICVQQVRNIRWFNLFISTLLHPNLVSPFFSLLKPHKITFQSCFIKASRSSLLHLHSFPHFLLKSQSEICTTMLTAISRSPVSWIISLSIRIKCLTQRLVSDQTIKLGTITIDEIVERLATACSTQGQCDSSPIEIRGESVVAGYGSSPPGETLTVNPIGSYPTWIHNGLIEALGAAVKAVAECKDIKHTPSCPNPMAYCPGKSPLEVLKP